MVKIEERALEEIVKYKKAKKLVEIAEEMFGSEEVCAGENPSQGFTVGRKIVVYPSEYRTLAVHSPKYFERAVKLAESYEKLLSEGGWTVKKEYY